MELLDKNRIKWKKDLGNKLRKFTFNCRQRWVFQVFLKMLIFEKIEMLPKLACGALL